MKCLIDNTEHDSLESLHKYLRKFKIKQETYYLEYYPRKDLLTGEQIPFKNVDQYLSADFINKINLKKWIQQNPEQAKIWAIEWLKKRKEKKNLVYAPTQVELRSLPCPSVHYYEMHGGYNEICKSIGLKQRFDGKIRFDKLPNDVVIIQDTREQLPLKFSYNIEVKKLEVGDYGLCEQYDRKIYIERKNLNDFVSTLASKNKIEGSKAKFGFERFKAELDRAKISDAYLIMVVESDINDALSFNYLPQMKWTKTNPSHIFKNLRDLLNEYLNFQVVFVKGKKEAASAVIKIFEAGESVKNTDLEYWYECNGF